MLDLLALLILAPADPRPYDGPTAIAAADTEPEGEDETTGATSAVAAGEPADPPPDPALPAVSAPPAERERPRTWRVGAAVDVGYSYSSNLPDNHVYRGMVPTPRQNELALNVVNAFVDHPATRTQPWHFELLLHAGAGVDALAEPEPVAGGSDGRFAGADVFKHVGLANVGVLAPTKTKIIAGLQAAPLGTEWFWPHRNWLHTASWVANGTPFYLMGLQVNQELPRDVHVFAWVVNGWQTIADVNKVPSYLAGLNWHPRDDITVAAMAYFGPDDRDPNPDAWRVHGDAFVVWDGERGGVGAFWDAGQEHLTLVEGTPRALWTGGAVIGRVRPVVRKTVALDLAARPEAWWDRNGRIFGVDQWLISATAGTTLHLFEILQVRLEYRYDRSTAAQGYFYRRGATADDGPLAPDQHLVMLAFAAQFAHRFALRRQ